MDQKTCCGHDSDCAVHNAPAEVPTPCNCPVYTKAYEAMAEIWGIMCPDCGPTDYEYIVKEVAEMVAALRPSRG